MRRFTLTLLIVGTFALLVVVFAEIVTSTILGYRRLGL